MKNQQRFEFLHPMLVGKDIYGEVRIEGVVYKDEEKGFDIDGIHYNGMNILPVLNWLGEGSVNELDKIYNLVEAHSEYVRETWNDKPDVTTDMHQLAAGLLGFDVKERRA